MLYNHMLPTGYKNQTTGKSYLFFRNLVHFYRTGKKNQVLWLAKVHYTLPQKLNNFYQLYFVSGKVTWGTCPCLLVLSPKPSGSHSPAAPEITENYRKSTRKWDKQSLYKRAFSPPLLNPPHPASQRARQIPFLASLR